MRISISDMVVLGRVSPYPRGSTHLVFEVTGSKTNILNGFRKQKPQILGVWTLWVIRGALIGCDVILHAPREAAPTFTECISTI